MKQKTINIIVYLAWIGLGVGLCRFDLGLEVFPVFGLGRRLGLGLVIIPMMGIVYGPLYGGLGSLAIAYLGQLVFPAIAFVGPQTFLLAPVMALVGGLVKKRNWVVSLLIGLGVIGWWSYTTSAIDTGSMTMIFVVSIIGYILVSGVYGSDFIVSENLVASVIGHLFLVLAGMNTAMLLAAGLALNFYDLPAFMWQNVNQYIFLNYTYTYSLLALLPLLLMTLLLPFFGIELGPVYYRREVGNSIKGKRK